MLRETTEYFEEGPMLFNVSKLITKIEKCPCSVVKKTKLFLSKASIQIRRIDVYINVTYQKSGHCRKCYTITPCVGEHTATLCRALMSLVKVPSCRLVLHVSSAPWP